MPAAPKIVTDRKVKVALVGYGRVAKSHIGAIEKHQEHIELAAVCDKNPSALAEVEKKYHIDTFSDYDELLAKSDADIVSLCTPSGLHPSQTIEAAHAGKHVLTEKPMATRWADGVRMVRACDEARVRLFVVKQNRLNPTIQALKNAIKQGRFGRIYMATLNVFWCRPQSYYDQAKWRGTWEFDGGAFMNQASHYIDLLHWLVGPVESVQSMTGTLARRIQAEDTGVINIKWRNGALGSVSVTTLTYPNDLEGSVTILGEKGTVRIGGIAMNKILEWQFADQRPEDATIADANYETDSVYGFGHNIYYQNVHEVLRGLAEPQTDGRQGLASLEVLIAAYRAARDGTTVSLPLEQY